MRVRGIGRLEDFSKIRPIIKNQAVNLSIKQTMMPQRQGLFLVVWLLMFNGEIFSQKKIHQIPIDTQLGSGLTLPGQPYHSPHFKKTTGSFLLKKMKENPLFKSQPLLLFQRPISLDFYHCNLSFICKKELQFEKITSIPLRLRLGSFTHVNYLEQKPGYSRPAQ